MLGSGDLSRDLCDVLLRWAGSVVPGDVRDEWLKEWRAEVAWRLRANAGCRQGLATVARCLGAFAHAAWLRWDRWRLEMLLQDVRYACRMLLKQPGFTSVALLTLALGIGANAAIFSVVHAVLLRPLPFPEPQALVRIANVERTTGEVINLSPADFLDFERETTTLIRAGANGWIGTSTVSGGPLGAERVGTVQVTEGFFPALRVEPAIGRLFLPEEDRPDGERVALLSDGFWRRRFGADPAIVGASITVNSLPTTVIGVLPPAFRHIEERTDRTADMFMPYRFDTLMPNRGGHFIRAVGRLAPGHTVDDVRAELGAIAARLEREHPSNNTNRTIHVVPLHEAIVGASRPPLFLLLGAVGLVLLVVCANLANLLLAAGAGRQREMAVRAAVGAGRGRLVRQVVIECLVLGGAGAAAGLVVAAWATRALVGLSAAGVPRAGDITVDWTVVAFAAAAGLVTSLAFGLLPALGLTRIDVNASLQQGSRQPAVAVRHRTRDGLIMAEVALSVVLLAGAALLTESLWRLQSVDPGFVADEALAADLSLPLARYPEGAQIPFYERLSERLRALPGVREVGAVNILPLSDNYDSRGIQIEDAPQPVGQTPSVQSRSVTPGYFGAMGIPLLQGRLFDDRDREEASLAVVVSQSMAARYWPGQDPIGRRLTFNSGIPREAQQEVGGPGSREIVGIVGDVRHLGLDEPEPVPMFYTPHAQQPSYHSMTVIMRTTGDPVAIAPSLRAIVAEMDGEVPVHQVRSLGQALDRSVAEPRARAVLVALFAVLALVLAMVGVYGVVGYLVSLRTFEIGVRLALGATPAAVMSLLVKDGMRPVAWGIGLGLAGALALNRTLQSMLFGVTPTEWTAYVVAGGLLGLAGLLGTLVPARRVFGVSPTVALRSE